MARKATRPKPAPVRKKAAAGADDLAILHPQREVIVAGRTLTIREYGFVEGMRMRALAQPFTESLYQHASVGGDAPDFSAMETLIADHLDEVLQLIAASADVDVDWIASLNDTDGYRLMQAWWLVNSGFFIRRVLQRLATDRAVARLAGPRSTTPSSAPATDARPTTSDG